MNNYLYDDRWRGHYGIARYSGEIKKEFTRINFQEIFYPGNVFSVRGSMGWQKTAYPKLLKDDTYLYSPAFSPCIGMTRKQIITIHDLIHLQEGRESSSLKRLFYEVVVKPVVKNSPLVFTVSNYSKQLISEWANISMDKIVVTGNAAGKNFTPNGIVYSPGFSYILYVGNYKENKNVRVIFEALLEIPDHIHLVSVGVPSEELRIFAHKNNLEGRIHILSDITEAELAQIYRGAITTIMPSKIEGFGIPILESMSSGTPVISSYSSCLPEIGIDACKYFDPDNIFELAENIVLLYENRNEYERYSKLSIERSKAFSWSNIAKIIEDSLLTLE